jgi:hypothetical protein
MTRTAKKKMSSYEILLEKKRLLKEKSHELEKEMGQRYHHLKSNYGMMAVNSVFPAGNKDLGEGVTQVKDIAIKIFGGEEDQSFLQSTIRKTIQVLIVRQLIRFFKGRKKKKKPTPAAAE